jgi:AAA domain, putative AbiEii toxin, Type IV TA system
VARKDVDSPDPVVGFTSLESPFHYTLRSISFSDGTEVSLAQDDIVVIVGGNNAGKSQALREIVKQLDSEKDDSTCVVVKRITMSVSEDEQTLNAFTDKLETQTGNFSRMGAQMNRDRIKVWLGYEPNMKMNLRRGLRAFTTYLVTTENRLQVTSPVASIDLLTAPKSHPFHYLADDADLEQDISAVFKKAFGTDLIVNRTAGSLIYLHVGARPFPVGSYNVDKTSRTAMSALPRLNDQGDGMRAFVGCLMWGTVVDYKIVLIDEPEAFLHPPQARLLGRTLVRRKKPGSQLVVASHSGDLLRGFLDANAPNLRILRLVRNGDKNEVTELTPNEVSTLWTDSLLRQTNVLDALFHQVAIICESDADCQFYSAMTTSISEGSETRPTPDAIFVQCGGMHRMPSIVSPLRALGVPVRVVADFDVLRDENPIRPLFEALGGKWSDVSSDWKMVQSAVSAQKAQLDTAELRTKLDNALAKVTGSTVPDSALREIKDAARKASAWAYAKTGGESFLPAGDVFKRYTKLKAKFHEVGLYIVPKGELESFCKSIDDHGPAWVEQVCKRNLANDPELRDAREFVEDLAWPKTVGEGQRPVERSG